MALPGRYKSKLEYIHAWRSPKLKDYTYVFACPALYAIRELTAASYG